MAISLAFSVLLYQLNVREVTVRLQTLQHNLLGDTITLPFLPQTPSSPAATADSLVRAELNTASRQMITSLIWVNLVVLIAGGAGSYLMARRTLRPIEAAHEAQSRFTSDASHELRTPLSAMKAEIEVNLRDPQLTANEAKELLESNLEEVNKLISLTEMLLHLSRLEYDKLEVSEVDIALLVEDSVQKSAQGNRFSVKTRKKASTLANEAAVTEVIDILMENALKYSPADAPILIRIFEQRGHIAFRIKNNGPAISKQAIDRLFDRFYRADQSRARIGQKGYGLGLSIAKKIVEIHGGYITVSSNTRETAFTFFLPIVRKATHKPSKSQAK
ncbi:hypothetical protein KI440_02405 [Candidatus Saccharibacteria bacterium TM7i]|nr:hypothetical protein KI440_02405 [Candidatus Saccharibacteria bacterium TM7i]